MSSVLLIFGWMEASMKHLSKYSDQYQLMYPSSTIVLIRSRQKHFMQPAARTAAGLQPVAKILREERAVSSSRAPAEATIHTHVFSNGGVYQLASLSKLLETTSPHTPDKRAARSKGDRSALASMPHHFPTKTLILDSCPGATGYQVSLAAFSAGLSGIKRYFAYALISVYYVLSTLYYTLTRSRNVIEVSRKALEADELVPPVQRTYIYSDKDTLIDWREVEAHVAKVRANGIPCKLEMFHGSAHVSHARADGKRYWKLVGQAWDEAN
ncbi:uncharacterized protein L969DRAFT_91629 [Mixia osmundae IAM 14324]|uniref:Uncharacterized protein n=1 Tax=Mixia osmundae (strain CBS 9802 / IAM 14324 / JCM 22182 / KY 12970) TaxID=764103 RepID=G7E012_MIXOS|nr:uncharacterized protein L969DRAFT_91629 [Mixia osmundae IAM 14324]KEI42165.1 hypothetical protein L969DRAFT_91629 [Mixia osmundae IAM 14324]GAA96172.1 hypothetical protein E5Q_02836 [Mixia osmundae IAM 14324]